MSRTEPARVEPTQDLWDNPLATDGFEFVEFSAPEPQALGALFKRLGFRPVARHRHKHVVLYRQGGINFILNAEQGSFAADFAAQHGPCACAMAFRVGDSADAYRQAVARGAKLVPNHVGPMELNIPTLEGIGGSRLYLIDRYGPRGTIYDVDFEFFADAPQHVDGAGLLHIDHLTHNVHAGQMDRWAEFYEQIFNFRETRFFDIEGKLTGLRSKAMTSPCGKIRIPINESADDQSQIAEFLRTYNGEGIQHIALSTADIHTSVDGLRAGGVSFLDTPDTYFEAVDTRIPGHGEDVSRLQANSILIDGAPGDSGLLLQIFTDTVIGPIFFEIIQRKGNEGFGEGNFKALFESIEEDQIRRGVIEERSA